MTPDERSWAGIVLVVGAQVVGIAAWAVIFVAGWAALGVYCVISGSCTTSWLARDVLLAIVLACLAAGLFCASHRLARTGSDLIPEQHRKTADRVIWFGLFIVLTAGLIVFLIVTSP